MPTPVPAINTLLKRGDGAGSETFTTIAEVASINGLQMSAMVQDVTTHSNSTPWREKITTLLDAGTVTFEMFFIPTDPTQDSTGGLLGDFTGRTKRNFKMVFPDTGATTWAFTGYVSKFGFSAPVDGVLKASVEITATGQPTLAG